MFWEKVIVDIETQISKANFSTWFKNTYILKQDSGTVYLGVPNEFVKDWLCNKYHNLILGSLRGYGNNIRTLEYVICKEEKRPQETIEKDKEKEFINTKLPLDDLYIDKEDNLNPRYTFDSFIIGSFNELAHAAAQAIINKNCVYNPLFINGGTGLGKTHLIQAIGNHIKKETPHKRIYYITSEKFSMDYINAMQANKINSFKEKYRKYDVFIMDDIQFLSSKEKTQEELFHLFNSLYEQNKQIIFSSDQHPNYIPNLKDRLKSRFNAGMIIDVQNPEFESRGAILKQKAQLRGFDLPDDTINDIATLVQGNIRELEGTLNLIIAQAQLKNRTLAAHEIRNVIKNNIKQKKNVSVKDVVRIVADFYDIEEDIIYEKTRKKEVVKPRQIIMFLLREDFNVSYPSIGQKLGGRDHTTVIHSCEKIKGNLKHDGVLGQEIDRIRAMF